MNQENYKEQLIKAISEKREELSHRKDRLNYNIFAGVCQKSILSQRKVIFYLELEIQSCEYKLQHQNYERFNKDTSET